MRCRILLFGPHRAALKADFVDVVVTDAPTCAEVLAAIGEQHPPIAALLSGCRLAVNQSFGQPRQAIGPGDELALIGMVSGG